MATTHDEPKKQVTMRLPVSMCTRLDAWSAITGRPMVDLVSAVIADALASLPAKDRAIIDDVVRARERTQRAG